MAISPEKHSVDSFTLTCVRWQVTLLSYTLLRITIELVAKSYKVKQGLASLCNIVDNNNNTNRWVRHVGFVNRCFELQICYKLERKT